MTSRSPNRRAPVESRRAGRPAVPLDRIIDVALDVVRTEGADALSMRTLAHRLGSGTATLYRHFDGRAALIAQVGDHVLGEATRIAGDLTGMSWSEACRTVARAMFEALTKHENVAPLLVEQIPVGPHAMALRERCIAVLLEGGFSKAQAAVAYATLARYVLGFAIQTSGIDGEAAALFQASDPSRFPATRAVADLLPVPLEEEFVFGLDLILKGLAHTLRQEQRARSHRAR